MCAKVTLLIASDVATVLWSGIKPSNVLTLLFREPLSDCLKDVDLIPPFNRMLLEVTFGKLYSWAIQNVRNILLEASARFKELGVWGCNIYVWFISQNQTGACVIYRAVKHTHTNFLSLSLVTRCATCSLTDHHQ